MGYIYLITNTVTGKRYVGQTQQEDIEREVGMYTLESELIKYFESIHRASVETNVNERCISGVCNGRNKTAGGYIWKFL